MWNIFLPTRKDGVNLLTQDPRMAYLLITFTLPETSIAPKKWWFPIGISFSRGVFSGAMLVSGRVIQDSTRCKQMWHQSHGSYMAHVTPQPIWMKLLIFTKLLERRVFPFETLRCHRQKLKKEHIDMTIPLLLLETDARQGDTTPTYLPMFLPGQKHLGTRNSCLFMYRDSHFPKRKLKVPPLSR